jgi:hypothetical protein
MSCGIARSDEVILSEGDAVSEDFGEDGEEEVRCGLQC